MAKLTGLGGIEALAADIGAAPDKAKNAIDSVFKRGGVEMKKKMQKDFSGSKHFSHIARSVTYDYEGFRLEVGPDAARSDSAPLAGIAYFGGARGGGGTVREPDYILEEEIEAAERHISQSLRDLL